jgi:hypothetical protein
VPIRDAPLGKLTLRTSISLVETPWSIAWRSAGLRSLRCSEECSRAPFGAQNDTAVSACDVLAGFKLPSCAAELQFPSYETIKVPVSTGILRS